MIQQNEAIMFLLGLGVLIFVLANRPRLQRLPAPNLIAAAFYLLPVGWALTILEGFFWADVLNVLEHLCYAGSAVLAAVWCWQAFAKEGGRP